MTAYTDTRAADLVHPGAGEHKGSYDTTARSDPMYAEAVAVVRQQKRASISTVQRHLRIGYNRAARLLEAMVGDVIAEMPPTTKLLPAPSHRSADTE